MTEAGVVKKTRTVILRVIAGLLSLLLFSAGAAYWKADFIVLGAEGYVFGYPLVIMDITRENAAKAYNSPLELQRMRRFPDAQFKDVVRPNVDTLYSAAFLDLSAGPWVFEMPPNAERYEVMPFMDAWTNVFATLGTRTTGTQGGRYLIAGPQWQGPTPTGMTRLQSPTSMVWLIGRTQTQGVSDYPVVHRLQDGLALQPLNPATPPHKSPTTTPLASPPASKPLAPIAQMQALGTRDFFERLSALMIDNPPSAADATMLSKLARIGIAPGQPVTWDVVESTAVSAGRWMADFKIAQELKKPRDLVRGWSTPPRILGQYGTQYNIRAVVAMVGLGANLPEDAMYPSTKRDAQGKALNGNHAYRIHFAADQLPPVNAFWSVTAYGSDNFLIDNVEHRYAVGSLSSLTPNADGSIDILIQASPPSKGMDKNWLPVKPNEDFLLNARLYWPQPEALDGRWGMPAVERLK
ncbi:DUF1254 domain-containing protein [Limnohabitans sp. Rim8]|uniref:DUF1254 domain-containing protein n=1 Tax=Limnohabitans sp. Rim8 TaxID=1100718 RepID=UPI00260D60AE|nr:DUF1254 domain-containing protein [Limnohabitans sp. Rim8]